VVGLCDPPEEYVIQRNGLGKWRFTINDGLGWEQDTRAGAVRAAWKHRRMVLTGTLRRTWVDQANVALTGQQKPGKGKAA